MAKSHIFRKHKKLTRRESGKQWAQMQRGAVILKPVYCGAPPSDDDLEHPPIDYRSAVAKKNTAVMDRVACPECLSMARAEAQLL